MTITEVVKYLRLVHQHHGDLEVVNDSGQLVIGVKLDTGGGFLRQLVSDRPFCLVSTKQRE